jgi:hypothetical protein
MLSAKVMPYLLRLAAPLLNSSIVQRLEFLGKLFYTLLLLNQATCSIPHSILLFLRLAYFKVILLPTQHSELLDKQSGRSEVDLF